MAYTNSKLVAYTKLSPNHSGARTHSIDRITPHCVVGQCTAEGLGDWFAKSSTKASSNYGIDRPMQTTSGRSRSNAPLTPRSLTLSGMWCIRNSSPSAWISVSATERTS